MFTKICVAFVFGLQTTKIFQLKGLKPKNKGHTKFYECCDLTKKVYLILGTGGVHRLHTTYSKLYVEGKENRKLFSR